MIHQQNIYGRDMVENAIERIKTFEPPEGYYLAFSGGKDSCVCKKLCEMAGVKFDAHYNITSVDPPELIYFLKEHHPDVSRDYPRDKDGKVVTMWNLIPRKSMPPTRIVRYCCAELKESSGFGRFVITGVRKAESAKRSRRGGVEVSDKKTGWREHYDVDNADEWMVRTCMQKRQRVLNPIIDWTEEDVWEFIHEYNVPYCKLYDEGWKRLGCIGCPMGSVEQRKAEFERYPKYRNLYMKAFEKMIENRGGATKVPHSGRTVGTVDNRTKESLTVGTGGGTRKPRPRKVEWGRAFEHDINQYFNEWVKAKGGLFGYDSGDVNGLVDSLEKE